MEQENKLRSGACVVAYIRVSTDGQVGEDKYGIDSQRASIIAYCNEHELNLVHTFVDEGKSGAKEDRPEFDKIIYGALENPPIEAVIVAKSDRVARDINVYYYYKHELLNKGIKLISICEDFGQYGTLGTILESFIVCMAQLERENITKRTTGGRYVKASKGGYAGGKTPFGYRAIGGKMVIDDREALIVKLIYKMYYKQKMSMYRIVKELENVEDAYGRSGDQIAFSTVQRIIKQNEYFYRGLYKYGKLGEWVVGEHKAILDEADDPEEVKYIKRQNKKIGMF